MNKKRVINIFLGTLCIFLGSSIYILFRPTSLIFFHWAEMLGLINFIENMRVNINGLQAFFPDWVIYSLPFSLWVASYLFFIKSIWGSSKSLSRYIWFWSIPSAAITAELGQIIDNVPGYFDIKDLILLILLIASSLIIFEIQETFHI